MALDFLDLIKCRPRFSARELDLVLRRLLDEALDAASLARTLRDAISTFEAQGTARIDHYSLLGIAREATLDQIVSAHRRLMRIVHPDKCAPDIRDVGEILARALNTAREVLGDEPKRRDYDRDLATKKEPASPVVIVESPRDNTGVWAGRLDVVVVVRGKPPFTVTIDVEVQAGSSWARVGSVVRTLDRAGTIKLQVQRSIAGILRIRARGRDVAGKESEASSRIAVHVPSVKPKPRGGRKSNRCKGCKVPRSGNGLRKLLRHLGQVHGMSLADFARACAYTETTIRGYCSKKSLPRQFQWTIRLSIYGDK